MKLYPRRMIDSYNGIGIFEIDIALTPKSYRKKYAVVTNPDRDVCLTIFGILGFANQCSEEHVAFNSVHEAKVAIFLYTKVLDFIV